MTSPAAGDGGHRLGDPGFRRLSVGMFAAGMATFALLYCTQPLLPLLVDEFDVSAGQAALTVSLATLGLAIGLLLAGPASEVWGRIPLMRASLVASALVGLACAVVPSWPALLALRGLQGLVLAGLPAVAMAYLREEVHHGSHARATGLYVGGTAIGGMLGRVLVGGLTDLGGWRVGVAGVAALGLACACLAWVLLPSSRRFRPASARPGHLLRVARSCLTDPVLLALYALAATLMGAFVAVYNALGFRLVAAPYLLSVTSVGLVFLVYAAGSVSSPLAGRFADRYGRRPVVPAAVAIMAAGILLTLASPLPVVIAGMAVMTFGFFAAHGVASGWVVARAHLRGGGTGQAASLYLLFYYAGSSVAGAFAGTAWAAGGWSLVVVMTGALTLLGGMTALGLTRTRSLLAPAPLVRGAPAP